MAQGVPLTRTAPRSSRTTGRHTKPRAAAEVGGTSLRRNSSFLIGATLSTSGLGYLYWIVAAHRLSPEAIGLGAGLISAFGLISFLSGLGVNGVLIQELPKLRGREWSAFFLACLVVPSALTAVVSVGVAVVLPHVATSFHQLSGASTSVLFVLGATGMAASTTLDGAFIALRRSGRSFVRNTVFAGVKLPLLVAGVLALHLHDADVLLLSWDLGLAAALVLGVVVLLPPVAPHLVLTAPDLRGFVRRWRTLVALQLTSVGSMLPGYVFPPLVVGLLSDRANATFYFTWSLAGIFFTISASIAQALFAEGTNEQDLEKEVRTATKITGLLLGPVVVVVVVLAHPLLLLFGEQYARGGTTLLRICALATLPDAITNNYVSVMLVQGRVRRAATLNCAMAAIAVLGAAAFLHHDGIDAAGWSWFAAQSTGAVFALVELWRWRQARVGPAGADSASTSR